MVSLRAAFAIGADTYGFDLSIEKLGAFSMPFTLLGSSDFLSASLASLLAFSALGIELVIDQMSQMLVMAMTAFHASFSILVSSL
jgi:hypothetical protein